MVALSLFCIDTYWETPQKQLSTACTTDRYDAQPMGSSKALKTRWQGHPLQALVEIMAETQTLKARWQGHLLQLWLNSQPKLKL